MSYMFSGCTNLENIILNFNTGVNTKKKGMMNGVKKVQNNLGQLNIIKIKKGK